MFPCLPLSNQVAGVFIPKDSPKKELFPTFPPAQCCALFRVSASALTGVGGSLPTGSPLVLLLTSDVFPVLRKNALLTQFGDPFPDFPKPLPADS